MMLLCMPQDIYTQAVDNIQLSSAPKLSITLHLTVIYLQQKKMPTEKKNHSPSSKVLLTSMTVASFQRHAAHLGVKGDASNALSYQLLVYVPVINHPNSFVSKIAVTSFFLHCHGPLNCTFTSHVQLLFLDALDVTSASNSIEQSVAVGNNDKNHDKSHDKNHHSEEVLFDHPVCLTIHFSVNHLFQSPADEL